MGVHLPFLFEGGKKILKNLERDLTVSFRVGNLELVFKCSLPTACFHSGRSSTPILDLAEEQGRLKEVCIHCRSLLLCL